MNTSAIALMIFAMVTVWGGLVLAVIHLIRHPDVPIEHVTEDYISDEKHPD
ncbi:methionine/alanine import family NSS transporter small subunit [Psychrobacter sp.]|uniref:methionine/alanine import family NSS transporter small subunit n=1 Tax=Psychrobacter sp. TaxID=56811 RepID=UPI0025CFC9B0|nr:methionine/alanine import family NSS transporter small subunit [Psychrobacter sp.]